MKNKKGITLIALIITIIVLLILAGVTISILTGENGVLNQAQESKEKTDKARIQEMRELTSARAAMNLDGYYYNYETHQIVENETAKTIYIPSGFAVSEVTEEIAGKGKGENEVDSGLVIIDKMGDEFVWIPVREDGSDFTRKISSNRYLINDDTNNGGNSEISNLRDNFGDNKLLKDSKSGPEATDTDPDVELNTVKNAKGFFVSRYEIGIESNVERSGLLSYMETSTNSGKYSATGTDKEAMRNQVPKLNSKQGMEPVRMITQLECLDLANEWKIGKDYQSGLMTGRTWDRMVSWICNDTSITEFTESLTTNSSSWGNYKNNLSTTYKKIFTSDSASNNWKLRNDGNWSRTETELIGDNEWNDCRYVFPTGEFITDSRRDTKMKNVYDVAGNVWEWTTEESHYHKDSNSNYDYRVIRGGSAGYYGSGGSASRRAGNNSSTTNAYWDFGFRCVLYVTK